MSWLCESFRDFYVYPSILVEPLSVCNVEDFTNEFPRPSRNGLLQASLGKPRLLYLEQRVAYSPLREILPAEMITVVCHCVQVRHGGTYSFH